MTPPDDAIPPPKQLPDVVGLREQLALANQQIEIYNTVLSATDDFAYIFDRSARFTYANRRLLEVWGQQLHEVIGKTCLDLGYPEWHAAMHDREVQQVIDTRMPIKGEVPYLSPTGVFGVYEYIFVPVFGPDGEVHSIAGTTRDVTDRKRAESLSECQRRVLQLLAEDRPLEEIFAELIKLLEGLSESRMFGCIMLLDEDGQTLRTVAAPSLPDAFKSTAVPVGPTTGSCGSAAWYKRSIFVSDTSSDFLWRDFRDLASVHGLAACWSCPILSSDDRVLGVFAMYYAEHRTPAESDKYLIETATRTAAIAVERKLAQQALLESRDAAEAANRAKDRFLAVLSHELRTPLTPVVMTMSLWQNDPGLPPRFREDLALVRRNLELETRLIDDMLDLSRIISGKLRLDRHTRDLNGLVNDVCGICLAEIAEKNITLQRNLAADLALVDVDSARIQQVIWNILKNAAKFTPEGGTIRISTAACGDELEVRFDDSGVGIPQESLATIFDAFEQIDANIGGLGLGLAISKALVELHGGIIEARSGGVGAGSSFLIRLPAAASPAQAANPESFPETTPVPVARRLLLVEDHLDTATVLRRLLASEGFDVRHASTVAEALDLARNTDFDVIVSDLGLPDATGCEFMEALVRENDVPPAIAMSGYGMEEDIRRSRAAGFTEHLVKPVDPVLLKQTISRLLDDQSASPSPRP